MCKSIFIVLPEKDGTTECGMHRTVSLMSHLTKLLLRILMQRMRSKLKPEISNSQFGFMADKGTRNVIFTLSTMIERTIEMKKDLYLCFIDHAKAFDRVKHNELFGILSGLDIDGKDLRTIRNLYWDQTAATRLDGEVSQFIPIKRGARQGCVLSPDLFNIYSERILYNIRDHDRCNIGGMNINNLRYADNMVLIAEAESTLQDIVDKTTTASQEKVLDLNIKETVCTVTSKNAEGPVCYLESHGESIKQVNTLKYLEYRNCTQGKCLPEVKTRITLAKDAFNKLKPIMKDRNISLK